MEQMRPLETDAIPVLRGTRADGGVGNASRFQVTLAQPIGCRGIGLHTGLPISLRLAPAPADSGITFSRSDLGGATVRARYDTVVDTRLSTVVGDDSGLRVATIEHLVAALSGCGIDNVRVTVDGPELPVLDGSSAEFCFLLSCAGRQVQPTPRRTIKVLRRIRVEDGDAFAELRPAPRSGLSLALSIDFAAAVIGRQNFAMKLSTDSFVRELASSRTFTQRHEIDALQAAGLARGGSLDNAIVVDGERVLNPAGLRHQHEFVRHKMLDAVGDLYLAGHPLQAGFIGHKSGHALNNRLLRALMADSSAWTLTGDGARSASARVAVEEAA
ncbi:UDP-3-O-[3-hydroxymyristoyl] N-acetylglucosamine deacetylase [Ameyamaea chiangmaiensis NBRC 103196]|uniref:UDP-3-O-acyl-N-acetylglucosamine deacetylase n=2 Tax=Ameyamaea chiangmaiensis TaxID=442969 RepID=A0A850PBQ0_9PROT|nr:UDP-3-O-acyl-N-acetylglucosamine deacetylase [Ameyamaea chiangmaiensis]NVN41965.1 UDP-3-O-acyl-N-acetylglucosamine deacetylase [Ameyamaea chiangmaiensis]GBQ71806.1 UDP-3-O-[3-hydroxymyristoyl] N-acetylglucosamine deacetylase [Ameyamaea chiangmaiensis NBRC 103196]